MSKTTKFDKNSNMTKYFSFWQRVFINALFCILLLFCGIVFLIKSFDVENENAVKYSEYSNLDYKVYLEDNDFYEQEYLDKDMIYVASLIDEIKVDFNYNFNIEEKQNIKFDYQIIAKLQIQDLDGKYTYYEKNYTLLDKKQVDMLNEKSKNISESININYSQYNKIANDFKNTYGVGTTSRLVLYFNINKTPLSDKWNMTNKLNNIVLNIPLSEKSINIDMNYKDINNSSYIKEHKRIVVNNIIYLIMTIVFIVVSIIYAVKTIRLLEKLNTRKNVYDIYVKKLLNEYDRLIVETKTSPDLYSTNKNNIIIIEKFTELLDVRDNLKQPIMYYVVTKHEKCHFYIINGDKIYLNTIKRVDLEEQKSIK